MSGGEKNSVRFSPPTTTVQWDPRKSLRCANTQPFLCNELDPFQAILGNFQAILGNYLGPTSGQRCSTAGAVGLVLDPKSFPPARGVGSSLSSLSVGSFLPNPNISSGMLAEVFERQCATT